MCRLTRDQELHHSPGFSGCRTTSPTLVRYLSAFGFGLKELHLENFQRLKKIFDAIDRYAPGLKILHLWSTALSRSLKPLEQLTAQTFLPNLEELHIFVRLRNQHAINMASTDIEIIHNLCKNRYSNNCVSKMNVKFSFFS